MKRIPLACFLALALVLPLGAQPVPSGLRTDLIERTARSGAENPMKLELAPRPVPLAESYEILKAILKLSL